MKKNEITNKEAEAIKEYRKQVKDKKKDRRLYAVQLRGEGLKVIEIARKLDTYPQVVSQWVKKYKEYGIEGLTGSSGGRHHAKMTEEEEKEFLDEFARKAEQGQIIEVSEIRKEYEKITGESKSVGHIYDVLHRNGWRKVMPRSRHPKKASEEAIEASKKLKPK